MLHFRYIRLDEGVSARWLPRSAVVLLGVGTLALSAAQAAPIEQIVVTAQKRGEQRLQEVPLAVQAVTGDQINAQVALELSDLASQISGLVVQDLGPGDRKYIIRGVNSTATAAVGVYYDEAPITARSKQDGGGRQADIELHDLARVEVLKGPQGTLYGASSSAGTIRYVPNRPDPTALDADVSGLLSTTEDGGENLHIDGMVNIPVVEDVFALRAVGWYTDEDGFIDNLLLDNEDINSNEVSGGKLAGEWLINNDWTATLYGLRQDREVGGTSRQMPIKQDTFAANQAAFAGALAAAGFGIPEARERTTQQYTITTWDEELTLVGGKLEWDSGPGSLLLAANYYERDIDFNFDSTPILLFFGVPVPAITAQPQSRETETLELRYSSALDGPVQFVVGGFLSREEKDFAVHVIATGPDGRTLGPFDPGGPNTLFGRDKTDELDQEAIFGEVEFLVNDALSFLLGARYYQFEINSRNRELQPFGGAPAPSIIPTEFNVDDDKVTGKANVTYRFTEDALAYFTVSQGFRPGGTNDIAFIPPGATPPPPGFGPDELINYEIGWKTAWLDNSLTFNGAVFWIDWEDLQTATFDPSSPFNVVRNAGEAEIRGIEFDLVSTPVDGLNLSLTGSFQDAEFASDVPGGSPTQPFAVDGQPIPNVPEFQFGATGQYTWQAFGNANALVRLEWSYQDDRITAPNDPVSNVDLDSFSLLNAKIGLQTEQWDVSLFMKNLLDEEEAIFDAINTNQDPRGIITARPRTVGLQLGYRFGQQ